VHLLLARKAGVELSRLDMDEQAAKKLIQDTIASNKVSLFMKGTPDFPQCGFSGQVVQILNYFKVPFAGVNVLEHDSLRGEIKTFSNWPTIPQLYVDGEFVGGCDIISEMAQSGDLEALFKEKALL